MLGESAWIDVSHHQGIIDWDRVKADGIEGAIIRLGDPYLPAPRGGSPGEDSRFEENVVEAIEAGVFVAVYYFWYDSFSASYHHKVITDILGDRVPSCLVIDVEDISYDSPGMSKGTRTLRLVALQDLLEADGYRVGFYTAKYTWNDHINDTGDWDNYVQWPAYWNSQATTIPMPDGWTRWSLWQYTASGRVDGISGNVDRDQGKYPIEWYRENWNGEEPGEPMPKLIWPIDGGRITQHFVGNYNDYQPQSFIGHMGTDVGVVADTPILAAADGIVQWVDYDPPGWGYYIRVLYPEFGFHGLYAHMIRNSPLSVGDEVKQGDVIGNVGTTGHSTGNHLHYSVRLADVDKSLPGQWDPDSNDPYIGSSVNPRGYVDPMLFHDWVNQMNFGTGGGDPDLKELEDKVEHMARNLIEAGTFD